jgi:MoxR-like ATPase
MIHTKHIQISPTDADSYKPSKALLAAINTALFLQRPLLLSGEPGSGKTECASFIARQLNILYPYVFTYPQTLRFNTKSTSQSSDLFYSYDAVMHFADKTNQPKESFISFNSLGVSILSTNTLDDRYRKFRNFDNAVLNKKPVFGSVVLIDEIDKAPRDFPNDLLAELEHPPFKFNIKELPDFDVTQDLRYPVFIVVTSNSEKGLPDAFLRRCIFHHISFPSPKELLHIVTTNLKASDLAIEPAIELFTELRQKNLSKKPGTSELIDWIACLQNKLLLDKRLANWRYADAEYKESIIETLGIIAKSKTDFELLSREISG